MAKSRKQVLREIRSVKRTIKILNKPENLDLYVIEKLKELLLELQQEL